MTAYLGFIKVKNILLFPIYTTPNRVNNYCLVDTLIYFPKNIWNQKKKFRLSTKIQTNKTIFTHELWVFDFFHTRVFNFFPHISGWVFCVCAVWNLKKKITSVFFKTKNFQTHKCIWKKTFLCVAFQKHIVCGWVCFPNLDLK